MVLLLLIHWLFVLSLVIGSCVAMHYLVAFYFCNHLAEEEKAGCFILIVLLLALLIVFGALSLPHSVVSWAAVCNCGISWSYLLIF